jgi:putative transposase
MVRLKERGYLPTEGVHILSVTLSGKAGRWFVSIQVEKEIEVRDHSGPVVGIDVGISRLATVSDGTVIANPRPLSRLEQKRKRIQRSLAKKARGSNNRARVLMRLARHELRIGNIRKDAQHKATTMLTRTKSVIGIENLNVAGLLKNHHIAKRLADASVGEFLRQLEYKTKWNGGMIVEADPFFPSTKRCSNCGAIKDRIPLSQRMYKCGNCGFEVDRDLNAANNLASVAASWAETQNACKSGEVHAFQKGRCSAMKQEPNTVWDGVLDG